MVIFQGVSCDLYDGLWYVSAIEIGPIYDNSLMCSSTPQFSHNFFRLKHLKALSFFSCFMKVNPVRVSTLRWEMFTNTLESLEFRSNPGLIGTIPTTIGYLRKLQSLVLLENGLAGKLPLEIGDLISLRKLVLSENHFVGQIPQSFGKLSELLILDLSRNNLSGSLPLSIGSLASLIKLDLSYNKLEGKLPIEIGNLKNVTLLDLGSNNFSGGLVQSFQQMVSLKELVISHNQALGGDLSSITQWENLNNLEVLDLSKTGLKGDIPGSISRMEKLRFLGLKSNGLSGKVPPSLASMPCISAIYISGNNLSGEIEFSPGFFRKLGRRFGAWENPNLCYNDGLTSKSFAPIGVKPCHQVSNDNYINGVSSEKTEEKLNLNVVSKSYFVESCHSFGGVFFIQRLLIIIFLWNVIL